MMNKQAEGVDKQNVSSFSYVIGFPVRSVSKLGDTMSANSYQNETYSVQAVKTGGVFRKHGLPGKIYKIIPKLRDTTIMLFLAVVLASSVSVPLHSQEQVQEPDPAELPRGFEELRLGLSRSELTAVLTRHGGFYYRGDPDVSLLERENLTLMEVEGIGFFDSAQFQFTSDDRLFVIVLVLNDALIDYFSLYTTFSSKYGEPADLSPRHAVWENETVRISLERPLVLRYIDRAAFADLLKEGEALESYERIGREDFLSRF